MSISADNKPRACQCLPGKIFYLYRPSRFPYLSSPAGHGSGPIHHHHQIIHIHLQESKTMRRNPGYSNPLSQHWDHIITTSITRRTVRPWLVMMLHPEPPGSMAWAHRLYHCLRHSFRHHMAGHCQTRRRLPNARQQEATNRGHQGFSREGLEPDAKQKMRVSNPLHQRGR